MRKIIALCGLSGAGKTYARTHKPDLKDLPFVDIADIYSDFSGIYARDAFGKLLERVFALEDDVVVIEASLARNHWQRQWLEMEASARDVSIEYREFNTPVETCIQRVKAQYAEQLKAAGGDAAKEDHCHRYNRARLDWLQREQELEAMAYR